MPLLRVHKGNGSATAAFLISLTASRARLIVTVEEEGVWNREVTLESDTFEFSDPGFFDPIEQETGRNRKPLFSMRSALP